jgi:hypothetical protein
MPAQAEHPIEGLQVQRVGVDQRAADVEQQRFP